MSVRDGYVVPVKRPDRFYIGGEWVRPSSGDLIDVVQPATEDVWVRVAAARKEDVSAAVAAARQSFDQGPWPHLTMARVKPEAPGSRKPALIRTAPHPLPEHMFRFFRPTRLVLFKSHLRRTGAEYEPMAELELPTAHDDQETER